MTRKSDETPVEERAPNGGATDGSERDLTREALAMFHGLVDASEEERADKIARLAEADLELARRVERLLEADSGSKWFPRDLEETPSVAVFVDDPPGPPPTIRDYEDLEEIATGGMGIVYRGVQVRPIRRAVAVKVLRPSLLERTEVLKRFQLEQRLLAGMNHPSIAKVYDAGFTECERPFVAMELVEGKRITEYCRRAGLSLRQKIRLFLQVCEAVTYAHQRGIIHRDLKPSNVLVATDGDEPVAKVIDFGIAKAILPEADPFGPGHVTLTHSGPSRILGTPEYMSPEQILGIADIETRTDVFSLGVLLLEMLLGRLPEYRRRLREMSLDELVPFVQEESHPLASDLAGEGRDSRAEMRAASTPLRGDLDWIVQKSLEPDRERRYQSVADLADDLTRYLEHRPVSAGPPDLVRRMRKLVVRHRWTVAALAFCVGSILTGAAGVLIGFQRVREEQRALARSQYQASIQLAFASLDSNATNTARDAIESCREKYRHWEWEHLDLRSNVALETLGGPEWTISAIDLSPDGERVAASTISGRAFLWSTSDPQQEPVQLPRGEASNDCIAFSPDGMVIARGYYEQPISLWSLEENREIGTLEGHTDRVVDVVFSKDGKRLYSVSLDKTLRAWDLETLECVAVRDGFRDALTCLDVSPDGRWLTASGRDVIVHIWRLPNLTGGTHYRWNKSWVHDISFSADGSTVFTTSGHHIQCWDVQSGLSVFLPHRFDSPPLRLDASPDGRYLAIGSRDSLVSLFDLHLGRLVRRSRGHHTQIQGLRFTPDSQKVVTGGVDETVRIWDVHIGTEVTTIPTHRPLSPVRQFPGSDAFVTSHEPAGALQLWNAATGSLRREIIVHDGFLFDFDFLPDGRILTIGTPSEVAILSADASRIERRLSEIAAQAVAIFPDGRSLVAVDWIRNVRRFDLETGEEMWTHALDTPAWDERPKGVTIADGRVVVGGMLDYSLHVLDPDTGELERRMIAGATEKPRFAYHAGRRQLVYPTGDHAIHVLDFETGERVHRFRHPAGTITDLALSPDGRRLFAATADPDGGVAVWDFENAMYLMRLACDRTSATSLAMLDGGSRLAVTSASGSIRIFETDIETLGEMAEHAFLRGEIREEVTDRILELGLGDLQAAMERERSDEPGGGDAVRTVFASLDRQVLAERLRAAAWECLRSWGRTRAEYEKGALLAFRAAELVGAHEDRFIATLASARLGARVTAIAQFLDFESRMRARYRGLVSPFPMMMLRVWGAASRGDIPHAERLLDDALASVRNNRSG